MRHKPNYGPTMARLSPLQINLKELPPEGQDFQYSHSSGELTRSLKDLVGDNPYSIQFKLTPMGNTFELKGSVKAGMDLQCSLCAVDFKHPVELKLYELILVSKRQTLHKGDQQSKANHAHEWETQGPDYILLESDSFHVGEYVHEMIALAEPLKPLGKPNCDENCENLGEKTKRPWLTYGSEKGHGDTSTHPFQVLEKIKLKG